MNAPGSTIVGTATAGWHADPWQRHQYRWFDGRNWTATVANNGVQSEDSGGVATPAPALPALPYAQPAPPQQQAPVVPVGYHQLPSKAPKRLGRSLAKGLFTLVCLLIVAVAVIAVIDPSEDEELQATTPEAFTVPVLLGPHVTHNEVVVDSTMFGEDWPLTVDSGTVVCEAVPAPLELLNVFFVDTAGTVYAVNGTAMGTIPSYGWLDVDVIWKPDPITGFRVDISLIIDAGLDICVPAPITDGPLPDEMLDAATGAVWLSSTPEQQAQYCEAWRTSPDLAREAFIAGSPESARYWPSLEQILQDNC